MYTPTTVTGRILRLPEVMERTGIKRSSIYDKMLKKTFPRKISLGGRSVGWLERDIDQWIQQQVENADGEEKYGR